ncbi:hypothetical protein K6Y31_18240 [Motilimonas cestriensis]|uniref:Uncharacterized protein n=1 Tax=Motilimonas cestriensis TaxID=2742685 RepID=A0ABS8WF18_9GAMM|nr:hypothetical protein [Motilimonas cestriensis]MCE2596727.1 hypothetical protein [Motilimonas cestriensis]
MTSIRDLNELLIEHNCLRSLSVTMNKDDYSYDLTLFMSNSEEVNASFLFVSFFDVSSFSSSEIGGGLTQFMHLNVRELEFGYDRVNYQLSELEDDRISFAFSSFDIGQR